MRALAAAVARSWHLLKRGPAKVLALDFDNTLWGGIFGEDGVANLHCGDDAPGNAFKAFQQECLRLKSMGMVLVALSKNNPEAISAFSEHPGMALKADDFVATAINWEPKPANIRRLAEDLNLGLDSFIFLDDSPHEREAMRQLCPDVLTPEMPEDPARRPEWLRGLAATWPVRLTAEDSRRSDMYAADRKAKVLRQQSSSIEDYLAGLGQQLTVSRVMPKTLARAAQMHARTNQFNLTTALLSDADLSAMMDDTAGYAVLLGHLADKFGDHGIVIAAAARIDGQSAEILSFLMSCRVVGRQVEGAFLGELIGLLADRGVTRISGAFIPTAKNAMVQDFYRSQGFSEQGLDGERHLWQWTAGDMERPRSAFIDVQWEA
ncbi:MAG: HAD-IIIC family phosphatase [Alphaproteobacteria bacterium]